MKLSFEKIKKSVIETVLRFPITSVLAVVLMLLGYGLIEVSDSSSKIVLYASHFVAVSMFVSLFFELWREEVDNKNAITLGCLLAIICVLVDTIIMSNSKVNTPVFLGRISILVALLFGIVSISFVKNKDDIQLWNFGSRIIKAFF